MQGPTPVFDRAATTHHKKPFVRAGALFSALLMLTVPFSTTISIAMSFLVFACWLLSSQCRTLPHLLRSNPVAASAMLLYGLFLIGTLYGDSGTNGSMSMLRKYRELLLLVILIPFLQEERYRRWMITAFIVGCVITLLGSYLKDLGILPPSRLGTATFKSWITHSLFMAFFGYYCAYQASIMANRRWLWLGLLLLTAFNLFVVVQGRTGQLIFILLMVLLFFQRFHARRALILAPLLVVCIIGGLSISGVAIRFQEGIDNSRDYLSGRGNLDTSMGQRLYFWHHSVELIGESPLIGYGTGSFAGQFSQINNVEMQADNPHNEYLMIMVQLGVIGLIAYLYFLGCQWYYAVELSEQRCWFARGVVLALAVNSLLNSSFLDHTEGHWFSCLIALSFAPLSRNGYKNDQPKIKM